MYTIDKTSEEPFKWLDTHNWTLENFWATICQFKDTQTASFRSPVVGQIDFKGATQKLNTAIEKMALVIANNQTHFESISQAFFRDRKGDSWPMGVLNQINAAATNTEPSFQWTVHFITYIASRASIVAGDQLLGILKDQRYSDDELLPTVLAALREGGPALYLVDQALIHRGQEIRKPLCLAALQRYEQAETPIKRQTLHDIVDRKSKFSMATTVKQLAAKAVPEALPVLDTIIALDLPLYQAWSMVVQDGKTNEIVALPGDFTSTNLTI